MRIITWNCRRKPAAKALPLLEPLHPDIVVFQELTKPDSVSWRAVNPSIGIGVSSSDAFSLTPRDSADAAMAVDVRGAAAFPLLGIWSIPKPTYVACTLSALDRHRAWLGHDAAVITGDFNAAPVIRGKSSKKCTAMMSMIESKLGLVSAYHAFFRVPYGEEAHPTHYWLFRESAPYHIDFVFVPKSWRVDNVEVGSYEEWRPHSDHVPVIVDVSPSTPRTPSPATARGSRPRSSRTGRS